MGNGKMGNGEVDRHQPYPIQLFKKLLESLHILRPTAATVG